MQLINRSASRVLDEATQNDILGHFVADPCSSVKTVIDITHVSVGFAHKESMLHKIQIWHGSR